MPMLESDGLDVLGLAEAAELLGWKKAKVKTYRSRGTFPEADKQLASGPLWARETILNYQTERAEAKQTREDKSKHSKKDIGAELDRTQASLAQYKFEVTKQLTSIESAIATIRRDLAKDGELLALLVAPINNERTDMDSLIAKTVAALSTDTPSRTTTNRSNPLPDAAVMQRTSYGQAVQQPAQTRNTSIAQTQASHGNQARQHSDNNAEETRISVLSTETTQTGTFKAACLTTAGVKLTVYANNENGIKLQQAAGTGKDLLLRVRALEHGFFAVSVRAA